MSIARGAASMVGSALGGAMSLVDAGRAAMIRTRRTGPVQVDYGGYGAAGGRTMTRAEAVWLNVAAPGALSSVSESRALAISTVWACLKVVSEDTARHEFGVVREVGHGLYEPVAHPLNQVINWRANAEMSAYSFWECMVWNQLFRGNSFAEIESSRFRRVRALWPLPTLQVEVRRDLATGQLVYDFNGDAAVGGKRVLGMTREAVLHLRSLSADGIMGMDWRRIHASTTLNKPAAIGDFVATFYRNYCKPLVAIVYPQGVKLESAEKRRVREAYMQAQSGENYGTPAVVDNGVKIETHALDLQTSQAQELLDRSPAEICSLFRVPPHKIGDLTRSTNNNIEAQDTAYNTECLGPMRARLEGELSMLVDGEEEGGFPLRVALNEWELTRGAMSQRADVLEKQVRSGVRTRNEARALEGILPLAQEIMDEATIDANQVPASLVHEVVRARAAKDGARDPAGSSKTPQQGGEAGARGGSRAALDADLVRGVVRGFAPVLTQGFVRTLKAERDKLSQARERGDYARRASEVVAGSGRAARGAIDPVAESVRAVVAMLGGAGVATRAMSEGTLERAGELYRLASQTHAIEQCGAAWDDARLESEAKRRAEQIVDELAVAVTRGEGE